MKSTDMIIPSNGEWTPIVATGSTLILSNSGPGNLLIRFGVDSESDGFVVPMNQNIMMSETCYVKVQKSGYNIKVVVTQ